MATFATTKRKNIWLYSIFLKIFRNFMKYCIVREDIKKYFLTNKAFALLLSEDHKICTICSLRNVQM